jgi:hypothetical protein
MFQSQSAIFKQSDVESGQPITAVVLVNSDDLARLPHHQPSAASTVWFIVKLILYTILFKVLFAIGLYMIFALIAFLGAGAVLAEGTVI